MVGHLSRPKYSLPPPPSPLLLSTWRLEVVIASAKVVDPLELGLGLGDGHESEESNCMEATAAKEDHHRRVGVEPEQSEDQEEGHHSEEGRA
jgi:hypothetical protein